MRISIISALLALALAIADGTAAQPPRLSLLYAGQEEAAIPPAFMDLLTLKLARRPDLNLLERTDVDQLLREQALGLLSGENVAPEAAVRAGQLLAVDAFALLMPTVLEEGQSRLRIRLVDSRYGILLRDFQFMLPEAAQFDFFADLLGEKIAGQLARIKGAPEHMNLVGVLEFRSIEPTTRFDYLADELLAGTEQSLMRMPGLVIAERRQVAPLSDERTLVGGLPPALRATAVIVDGEYALRRDRDNTLSVHVRGRRDGEPLFIERVEGPLDDPYRIARTIAEAVSRALSQTGSAKPMDPAREAEMLHAQSEASTDYATSIGAAEAAMALMPKEERYQRALLHRLWVRRLDNVPRDRRCPHDGGPHPVAMQRAQRYANVLDLLFATLPFESDPESLTLLSASLFTASGMIDFIELEDREISSVRHLLEGRLRPLVDRFMHAYQACLRNEDVHCQVSAWDGYRMHSVLGFQTVEAAQEFGAFVAERAGFHQALHMSNQLSWPPGLNSETRFEQERRFYESMRQRQKPLLRLLGKRGLARIHAARAKDGEYALARKLYEEYETYFLNEVAPHYAEMGFNSTSWIFPLLDTRSSSGTRGLLYHYYADPQANWEYKADRVALILKHVLKHTPLLAIRNNWIGYGDIQALRHAGRHREMYEILGMYIEAMDEYFAAHPNRGSMHIKRTTMRGLLNMRRSLVQDHPELATPLELDPGAEHRAHKLMSLRDLSPFDMPSAGIPRRLIIEGEAAAVLYENGLLRLDSSHLKPIRFDGVAEGVTLSAGFVVDDGDIYVSSSNGVIVFPKEGGSRLVIERGTMLPEGVGAMAVMGQTLYAVVGGEALIAFDQKTGQSRTLLSAKATLEDQMLHGFSRIGSVVADPYGNPFKEILLFNVTRKIPNGSQGTYMYDPMLQTFERSPRQYPFEFWRHANTLVHKHPRYILFLDMSSQTLLATARSQTHRFDAYSRLCRVGKGMVGLKRGDLNYFGGGSAEPQNILEHVFPPHEKGRVAVHDVQMHKKGLVLMTFDALYVVPSFKRGDS